MPTLSINGARLHYASSGSGPQAVLFAHGLLWSGRMFDAQVAQLEGHYRCVSFDFRGQGQSEVTRDGYDMDSLTEDAAALIESLGLAPCHFAGLSMGGFVGLRLAIRRPELLRSLILIGTSADAEPSANVPRYRRLALVARWLGLGVVKRPVMRIMFGTKFLDDPQRAGFRRELERQLVSSNRVGVTNATRGVIERESIHDQLSAIRLPTLILVGDQDVATPPEKAQRLHEAIAGSRLVVIPGAGHTSTLEEPDAVNAAIAKFLAELD